MILEGRVEIRDHYGTPEEQVIIAYGPREFLGEKGLLTGQRVFLTAVATRPGRVLRVPIEQVRTIMAEEADLSDYLLRAFLLRHVRLTQMGLGLTLVGPGLDEDGWIRREAVDRRVAAIGDGRGGYQFGVR